MKLFEQGMFTIDPNATPDQLARRRERIMDLMQNNGSAKYVGQGLGHLATGILGGKQLRDASKLESEKRQEADDLFSSILTGFDQPGRIAAGHSWSSKSPLVPSGGVDAGSTLTDDDPRKIGSDAMSALGIVPEGVNQSERDLLAKTLMAEAGGEGYDGMLAAGAVIGNRANTTGYGNGIEGVIMKPGQFSAWNGVTGYAGGEGALDMANMRPNRDAYAAADAILTGQYEDPTGGATHYYNPSVATPKWGQQAGGEWARIGNHIFGNADAGRSPSSTGGQSSAPREVIAAQNAPNSGNMAQLQMALANPWLTPAQKQVIASQLEMQMKQQDPMYQAQLAALTNPQPDLTSAQREYEMAKQQGFEGSFLDYKTALAEAGRAQTNVTTNVGGENEFAKAFAKGDAATISSVAETGLAAQRNIGRIDQLESLLSQSPSGFSAWTKQAAGEWGVNTEGLSDIQSAQALINSLVPEQRQPGSGPMSDADLELFKQSLPRIINTPEGNATIIRTMRAIAQYDAQGAVIVQRLRSGEITRAEAFAELQARENPLAGFKAPSNTETPTESDGVPTYNPETGKWE